MHFTRSLRAALALVVAVPLSALAQSAVAPPNRMAIVRTVQRTDQRDAALQVTMQYEEHAIFDGAVAGLDSLSVFSQLVDSTGGRVTQVLKWTSFSRSRLTLRGVIRGSDEAFPAQADRPEDAPLIVRHSIGLSHSRLNRAVYDRSRDWVLSADEPATTRVTPGDSTSAGIAFTIEEHGQEVSLRFRPRYYQRHRGLAFFEPWTYRVRRDVPIGWTSWFAYFDKVTEADIKRTADMMAERLLPWGYSVLQLDDGYQQLPIGVPDHWLTPNAKFPSGMASLAAYERQRGLLPAIWTNVSFADAAWAKANPRYFLRDRAGAPVRGNWVGYAMDGTNARTFPDLMEPVYRGFRDMGYGYFKLDALRHLKYEGYNSNASSFTERGIERDTVFRRLVQQVRATIGQAAFLLACWGARPELIGLVDAVRIGDDGFGYGGLAQYNSFNNVVWRNDPDHIELSKPDAYAAITATTLTGSHLMLTDKAEFYLTPRADLAHRAAPVPFTLPGQLYDLEPSRSSRINDARTELSGAGPRPFDADQAPVTDLYLLDVNRPFERWTVLGRTGPTGANSTTMVGTTSSATTNPGGQLGFGGARRLDFRELGLTDSTDYLVFEAWTRKFFGVFRGTLLLNAVDSTTGAESLCIRERVGHPQVLATSRHLTCGAMDLHNVSWNDGTLSGESDVVGGEPYELLLYEPSGTQLRDLAIDQLSVTGGRSNAGVRTLRIESPASKRIRWTVRYVIP